MALPRPPVIVSRKTRIPALLGQAAIGPHSHEFAPVKVRYDQVAIGRQGNLLMRIPEPAIKRGFAPAQVKLGNNQFDSVLLYDLFGYVPHACIRQGGIERHNGSQIRSAPVKDAHFPYASDSLGFAEHKEFAFLLINCDVPYNSTRVRIAFEEEFLQLQSDLACGAGMR